MYNYFKTFINNVLNHLDEGVYFTDLNKNILYWNSGIQTISGHQLDQNSSPKCCQLITHIGINGEKLCDKQCPITKVLQDGEPLESSMFIRHKEGHLVPVTVKTFPVIKNDQIVGVIEVISDNTQKKFGHEKVKALTKAAYVDSLSGLVNKQYIESRLELMLKEIPEKRESFGVLYININGFRAINELYGVTTADKVLRMVATTLSSCITSPNLIGRWHGASFIAILDTTNKTLPLMLASKIKMVISESVFPINGDTIQVTLSVGYTTSQRLDSLDYIIERATKASLEEKEPVPPIAPVPNPSTPSTNNEPAPTKLRFHSKKLS